MNTAPIRTEAILPRIDGITRNITKLRKLGKHPLEEFEKRDDVFDLSQHHLRLALEGVFHIGSHILARLPGSRVTSYKEIASELTNRGVVDKQFGNEKLIKMAGYRTRLTHFYQDVTPKEIYEIISNDLGDIEVFLVAIKDVLKDPEKFNLSIS